MVGLEFFGIRQPRLLASPERPDAGWWVGPGQGCYDTPTGAIVVPLRFRAPRDGLPGERGYQLSVLTGTGGGFKTIWQVNKASVPTASLEMAAVRRGATGTWQLFMSHLDQQQRWVIELLEANRLGEFEIANREPALLPDAVPIHDHPDETVAHVKDPVLLGRQMLVSTFEHEPRPAPTYLATSPDGRRFQSGGLALPVGADGAWDDRQRRITAIVDLGEDGLLAFYDGGRLEDDRRERGGMAVTDGFFDEWTVLTEDGPLLTSPHGTGSLRYISAIETPRGWFFAWEQENPPFGGQIEGSHSAFWGYTTTEHLRLAVRRLRAVGAQTHR